MKKILSILICVLCGVSIAFSQGTVTINGYAIAPGIEGYGGGTITVTGYSAAVSGNIITGFKVKWNKAFEKTGVSVISDNTASEGYKTQYLGDKSAGIKVSLAATPVTGYYFKGFTEDDNNVQTTNFISTSTPWNNNDKELEYKGSNYILNYYAIFKPYRYGYSDGRSVAIWEGADYGQVSLDGNSWANQAPALSNGETRKLRQSGDAIDDESDKITFTYYAKPNDDNCTFLGWYVKKGDKYVQVSADDSYLQTTYNYDFYPSSEDEKNPSKVPTLYARFGKKTIYKDQAVATVVLAEPDGTYNENAEDILLQAAGAVYVDYSEDANPQDKSYQSPSFTCGIGEIKNTESGKYYYTYYALPRDGYIFVGWSTDLDGDNGKIKYISDLAKFAKYTHEHYTTEKDDALAPSPEELYAVFKKNTFYYYKGAIAGFTENGEKGIVTITSKYYNTATEGEDLKDYKASTTDALIDDSKNIYNTALNVQTYTYTYKAENLDPEKTTWKGWSRSPRGGNIIDENTTHTEEYTSWALTRGEASPTPELYAVFQSYWYKDPTASAVGAGQVDATYEEGTPDDEDRDWRNSIPTTNYLNQEAANDEKYNYSVWYYAKPNFGAYFKGWSQVADGSQLITDDKKNPYKVDYSVTATDDTAPFVPARLYAVFESVIQVIQKDRMIYYVDEHGNKNVNDANVIVNFNKAPTLTATLKDNHDLFRISDKQNVQQGTKLNLDASEGISHFVVSYIGNNPEQDVADKKTATITLSSSYTNDNDVKGTATIDIEITIEEMPFVSFLPTDGKGSYTIKHTDGRGIDYSMPKTAAENINVSIAQENMATFELNLTEDTENDGLKFAGWQMIVDNVASYFSYDKKCTHSFKESAFVRPVFLADDRAVFMIDGDPLGRKENNKYYDLQEALNDAAAVFAETNVKQVVVFSNEGKQTGTLYQGNYEIPEGVILLIPGVGPNDGLDMPNDADEDKYIYRLKHNDKLNTGAAIEVALSNDDYFNTSTATVAYRKLYVEDNTIFTVQSGGVLYLYATVNHSGQTYEARPYHYGQMILGENCRINVENGAELYAFGFITGANSSRVVAKSGAEVHELFQYSDPRGGTGVAHLFICRKYYKVFPFSQYYIQNVEVPLEIQGGATEYVTTTADVMDIQYVLMTPFVIPETTDKDATGLFQLNSNTSFIKYYDPQTDRQKLIVKGISSAPSSAKFGFIKIQMGDMGEEMLGSFLSTLAGVGQYFLTDEMKQLITDVKDVKLDSRDYVLPLNHNMDISIENANLSVSSEFAFLAGSTLTIDEASTMNLNSGANIYIYDAVDNLLPENMRTGSNYGKNTGYFASTNEPLIPIFATPNNTHKSGSVNKRQAQEINDAKWIVNGIVNVNSGAGLFTTSSQAGEHAQIISTQNGKVYFSQTLQATKTYQAKYTGKTGVGALVNTSNITINKEGDGAHHRASYAVESAKLQNANGEYVSTHANTFYYHPDRGVWLEKAPEQNPLQGAEVQVTLPDYDLTTDEVDPCPITLTSNLQNVENATIVWNGGDASDVRSITPDATGLHIAVDYTPTKKAGEYEGLLSINNDTYYQRITVIEDYTPRFKAISEWDTYSFLGYSADVNAGLEPETDNVAGILSGTYASDWTYAITGANADEFTLVWGEGENKLSDAKIVFKPKTAGSKEALLALTCTYTDAANVTHTTCVQVPLTAVVHSLAANTLAFADGVESIFRSSDAQQLFKNANSNAPITITPATNDVVTIENVDGVYKIAPKALGSVTIKATQEADLGNGIAATTITKTITVTEDIVWNWEHLYFGSTNTNPVTTKYDWRLEIKEDKDEVLLDFDGQMAKVNHWTEGETEVIFTLYYDNDTKQKECTTQVYRDPRRLSISVNDERIYEAITVATTANVEYAMGYVALNSAEKQPAQWTFQFIGIPDELSFTATGINNWQIEESPNGNNWSIAYTWAKIAAGVPFELSLQPSTRYVRISYGTEHAENVGGQLLRAGTLSNIAVSELKTVKADVTKLYMPAVGKGESTSKNVVFTYASEEGFDLTTTNNVFSTEPDHLSGLDKDPFYVIKRVAVNSSATSEILGALNVKGTETSIPIQVFGVPQAIPIQLASDHAERYYYVASQSYRTTWDETERAVVMHNAVADASPYVVFHYADAPTPGIVSFNYSAMADGARWLIEKSTNGTSWNELNTEGMVMDDAAKSLVMRRFPANDDSRYLRITLVSDYAENVSLTNVAILPTANVVVNPASLTIFDDNNEKIAITANNLQDVTFTISEGFQLVDKDGNGLTADNLTTLFRGDGAHSQDIYVKFLGTRDENEKPLTVADGTLTITTTQDAQDVILATVQLLGVKRTLAEGKTGIYTGVKTTAGEGETAFKINGFTDADGANYREVDVTHAFASGTPLFDYVIIYGATTTDDESTTITTPTSTSGSNAKTPCYIYKQVDGAYKLLDLNYVVENANASTKSWKGAISISDTEVGVADSKLQHLKVYITGFAPYASTGYSKADNAVWHFKGDAGDKIDIYLEDCYIYSRYKTKRGNSFSRNNGETFSDKVARGSGAVLMFENNTQADGVTTTMDVTIHTRGTNLLKSHYGCLFESIVGRAFQVSAPVQIYMQSESHVRNSYTILNFTDEWPTAPTVDANGDFTTTERTNGFVSLRKQVNNAPSIDMGNTNTVVNFRGGRVELQNACNSSDNYESTLAISARSGIMGPAKFRFRLAYGIGTDEVGGRVNFYDGTTTVLTMTVPERYRQYYLMDGENEDLPTTSCLRTPKKTFIYGGSHCMMRACTEPTSKGGAPTDGDYYLEDVEGENGSNVAKEVITGNPLGLYQYTNSEDEGWTDNGTYGLVTPTNFPRGLEKEDKTTLASVHEDYPEGKYGVESITPTDGVLNLWIPGGFKRGDKEVGKQPEVEQMISYWKACMTYIEAKYGVYEGSVGGSTAIQTDAADNQIEQVQNLLYCEIDQNILDVIVAEDYVAPVLNPAPVEKAEDKYMSIAPTQVGTDSDDPELKNNIENAKPYKVENKVYYIVPAKADIWMAFTAPFNVKKLWIMETRTEDDLFEEIGTLNTDPEMAYTERDLMLQAQARHNADFASFFGVAMALDSKKPFDDIYQDYIGWAKLQDGGATERGKYPLIHFDGTNWSTANYYLYENGGVEEYTEEQLKVNWQTIPSDREVLMTKGNTYSLFFPYCMGCWEDGERDFWDYWTGKFLIFESTDGMKQEGHLIDGANQKAWEKTSGTDQFMMLGNTSFTTQIIPKSQNIYTYTSDPDEEGFDPMKNNEILEPTQTFLYANITAPVGQKVTRINRDGKIIYGPSGNGNNPGTGVHTPTVGGDNSLFITAINGGINVAVATPQHVRVLSATGAVLYSGMVQTAVDVNLPTDGIYIVSGEKEVQKILY